MNSFLLACAKEEAKKLVKPRGFLKKSILKENVVAPTNQVLHFHKFDVLLMKQFPLIFFYFAFSKFGLLRVQLLIGRIKIQTCQIPCNLADLPAGF